VYQFFVLDQMSTQQSLPKYLQISELLIRDIAAGRLEDGARLPTERDLAAQLSTSVGTLRKALSELERQGFARAGPRIRKLHSIQIRSEFDLFLLSRGIVRGRRASSGRNSGCVQATQTHKISLFRV
jgi:DNA-binding transcriptional MocR family regulator